MRNGKLGALALGLGLTLSVAAPAMAQDEEDAFAADFLGCAAGFGVSECTEEVLENAGLEEEEGTVVVTDLTPFNPIDEGSIVVEFVDDVVFPSEVAE